MRPAIAALLSGRYWLIRRRLWAAAIASSAVALLLLALALSDDAGGGAIGWAALAAGLALLGLAAGLGGPLLHRRRIERLVDRVNLPGQPAEAVAGTLRRRGGLRWPGVALLALVEVAAAVALVHAIDPQLPSRLRTAPPPAEARTDLVDMAAPSAARTRTAVCIANPTDATIRFQLRYGTAAPQDYTLAPHSPPASFWSRSAERPVIDFDHVLGDGIVYDFTRAGTDLDLVRRPETPPAR